MMLGIVTQPTAVIGRVVAYECATSGFDHPACQFTLAGLYFSTNSTAALSITFLVSSRESQ